TFYRKAYEVGTNKLKAIVVVNIDQTSFRGLIGNTGYGDNFQFYLTNANGDIIASNHSHVAENLIDMGLDRSQFLSGNDYWEQSFDKSGYLVSHTISDITDWGYTILVDKKEAL